jgi:hypothetical protein
MAQQRWRAGSCAISHSLSPSRTFDSSPSQERDTESWPRMTLHPAPSIAAWPRRLCDSRVTWPWPWAGLVLAANHAPAAGSPGDAAASRVTAVSLPRDCRATAARPPRDCRRLTTAACQPRQQFDHDSSLATAGRVGALLGRLAGSLWPPRSRPTPAIRLRCNEGFVPLRPARPVGPAGGR